MQYRVTKQFKTKRQQQKNIAMYNKITPANRSAILYHFSMYKLLICFCTLCTPLAAQVSFAIHFFCGILLFSFSVRSELKLTLFLHIYFLLTLLLAVCIYGTFCMRYKVSSGTTGWKMNRESYSVPDLQLIFHDWIRGIGGFIIMCV